MGRLHELRTHPEHFAGIWEGRQKHEVRTADRLFVAGDRAHLREFDPGRDSATGRWMEVQISYVTEPGTLELPVHVCVLSYDVIERHIASFAKAKYGDLG